MAKYEGSPEDKKRDKSGAKKAGISLKSWERSAADRREDKAGQKRMSRKKKKK